MAAKVNKTVVISLIAGVICVLAGVIFLMNVVLKSSKDLAARGDRLMEKGEYDEASKAYSKAVNKEQNNIEYIKKWADSLSKQTPASLQAYSDRYRQWLGTQRLMANVLRVDPEAHRAVLNLVMRDARINPRSGPAWQSLETEASDIITRMAREPQDKIDQIRRYRGIATVGKMSQALEVSADDRKRAKEDLQAALRLNPDDAVAALYYADLMRISAEKARMGFNQEEADLAIAEGTAVLQDFCDKHPTSTLGRIGLQQLQLAQLAARVRQDPAASAELELQVKPLFEKLIATLESDDPKTVDEFVAAQAADLALQAKLEKADERGAAVFDRICQARPDEPFPALMRARFLTSAGKHREAADAFKKIMDLPNLPISPAGLAVFAVRDSAAIQRVDTLIDLARKQKIGTPERAAAIAEAKVARDELRARATIDDAPKTFVDAKIAVINGDNNEARKLLSQYNQMTGLSDPMALRLAAEVLHTQGLKGEAKNMLTRVVEKNLAGPADFAFLARIDYELRNFPSARTWLEQALSRAPNDPSLLKFHEELKNLIAGTNSDDPFQKLLGEARQALTQAPPDKDMAASKAMSALSMCERVEDFINIAQILGNRSRQDALVAVDRGLVKFPDNAVLKQLRVRYSVENPVQAEIDRIISDTAIKPIDKAVGLYLVYGQLGRAAEAETKLDEAAAIDPEHQVVVAGLFERALVKGDFAKAAEFVQKAKEKNHDKVDGRMYQARLLQAQGKLADAIPLLERATELDPVNPLAWRFLAGAYSANGERTKCLRAIERSLQIKPDDIQTIILRIQSLIAMDRMTESLAAAREAERIAGGNPAFVQLLLMLEFRYGDKDKVIDVRRRILASEPANIQNVFDLARCLVEVRRLDEAEQVMSSLEQSIAADESKRATFGPSLGMLKAAVRGSRNDPQGALADFEKLVQTLPEERRESAYVEFAALANSLTRTTALAVSALEAGLKWQDYRAPGSKDDSPRVARIDRMLGDLHFQAEEWDKARAAYTRARETMAVDEDKLLLKRVIECHMKAKQFDEARRLLDGEGGDRSSDLQILLLAAQLELSRGDKSKALEIFDRAQAAAPNSALPYRQRGVVKMADNKTLDDAIVDFELAVGHEPRNPDLVVLLSRAHMRKGDPARALQALDKALQIQPESLQLRNEQVETLLRQNKTAEALGSIDQAMKIDQNNPLWPMRKGVILQRQDKQREAAEQYQIAWRMTKGPDTGKALVDALIGAYDRSNPKESQLLDYAKSILDDPACQVDNEPLCRLSRMSYYLRQGRRNEAVADLRAVIGNPRVNLGENQTGVIILDELRRAFAGNMNDVLGILNEVVPAAGWPEMFKLTILRAQLSDVAMREKAMADLEALTRSPEKPVAVGAASTLGANQYLAAEEARKKNDTTTASTRFERAVNAFQTGLGLDPDNTELNNNLAFVLAKGLNRPADALPYGIKAAAKEPNNANILDTLGVVYLMLNDLPKTEDTLNRALSASTDGLTRTMPLIHMIDLKLKRGDRQAAESLFRELNTLQETEPRVKSSYQKDIEEITKRMQTAP
ncbi:MAG TPA: tetratricopeptide repeat protein [Phycisphaerales bacterium]|nr:tetratricopeptide repeat protein [Phycisphaerales bacterium]